MKKPLKPVVFVSNKYPKSKHFQNTSQQMMLLKAMTITQDPKKLKEMIGVKTVAEVYRTLDKMALRKEFHSALAKAGIDFSFIVEGIKSIALTGFKDSDKLNAYKTLLASLGMDKYQEKENSGGAGWEEVLLKVTNEEKERKMLGEPTKHISEEYEVKQPRVPESVRRMQEESEALDDSIYG